MPDHESDSKTILENELIFGVRRRERMAWAVAICCSLIGLGGVGAVALSLPLKETQAFVLVVDKDTGATSRVVQVEAAGIEQREAVEQSLLYTYVKNRETYDAADNEARLLRVYNMSSPRMRDALKVQWNKDNPDYPPVLYGSGGKVLIEVLSVTPIGPDTAQVRFTKRLKKTGEPDRVGKFYATISYEFQPTRANSIELVWENPFGFVVTDYRVTAESLEAQAMEGKT